MSGPPKTPLLTVDVIVELEGRPGEVVLIERRNPPPGWALPGGFVDWGESVAAAARREALEETSLEVELIEQFFVYSDPRRDARGSTASVVFLCRARGEPRADDDAKNVRLFPLDALPPLAFDHRQILDDYCRYRASGARPPAER
jgi:8-oxo-dGTP diphosphatase